jgi:RNA polymerase sigma-70 factor, ECF subfamily
VELQTVTVAPEPESGVADLGAANLDRADLESVVRQHQAGVWRYLRLLGCTPDAADDLTQETFLVVLRRGFERRGERETWSFLRQTARHIHLRQVRDKDRRTRELRADLVDGVWMEMADDAGDAWIEALRICVERLEGRPQEVVRLFYREGYSRANVARYLAMKETGVKTLLQRTRAVLRDCIRGEVG